MKIISDLFTIFEKFIEEFGIIIKYEDHFAKFKKLIIKKLTFTLYRVKKNNLNFFLFFWYHFKFFKFNMNKNIL